MYRRTCKSFYTYKEVMPTMSRTRKYQWYDNSQLLYALRNPSEDDKEIILIHNTCYKKDSELSKFMKMTYPVRADDSLHSAIYSTYKYADENFYNSYRFMKSKMIGTIGYPEVVPDIITPIWAELNVVNTLETVKVLDKNSKLTHDKGRYIIVYHKPLKEVLFSDALMWGIALNKFGLNPVVKCKEYNRITRNIRNSKFLYGIYNYKLWNRVTHIQACTWNISKLDIIDFGCISSRGYTSIMKTPIDTDVIDHINSEVIRRVSLVEYDGTEY